MTVTDPPKLDMVVPKPLRAWIDALLLWLIANRVIEGLNVQITDASGGGKQISALGGSGGLLSPPQKFPFQLLVVVVSSVQKIRVRYGTVNGTEPSGMSPGDDPPYIIAPDGTTGYVYLVVGVDDDYAMTSLSIDVGATVPADTTSELYLQIGSYAGAGTALVLAQSISGSQGYKWCGSPLFALS